MAIKFLGKEGTVWRIAIINQKTEIGKPTTTVNLDYVLIDCMPSLDMLTINTLAASDSVIVPVQARYFPAKGITQLMKTIGKVQRQIHPALKMDGVLLILVDMRINLGCATAESM